MFATATRRRLRSLIIIGLLIVVAGIDATTTTTTTDIDADQHLRQTTTTSTPHEFRNSEHLVAGQPLQLPDVSHLAEKFRDKAKYGHLVAMLDVWKPTLLGSDEYRVTKDHPFTIIVPKIDVDHVEPDRCAEFLREHLVPGVAFSTFNDEDVYGNLNGHQIVFEQLHGLNESQWTLNGVKILRTAVLGSRLSAIFIDGVLGDGASTNKAAFAKRNIQEVNRYNAPERLEMKNATKEEQLRRREQQLQQRPSALLTFLAGMKSGTKVFQHFLNKSKLTQDLDDSPYTILIPSDNAFQRWHPIDWGFYPFSVHEFTESVLRNHFLQLRQPLRMADVQRMEHGAKYKTLGGEVVVFRNNPSPSVNNVSILRDYTLPNGNEVFLISEVLFVSEAVVSRLHQMHKDKETPPLLAFPWFGAQFLSHSFLALERDIRFTQITRFLNCAEIAQYVSGANYTFFVPTDEAFERLGFDRLPDEVLASEAGVKLLLNHFIRGRLYERDLRHDDVLETIGGAAVKIQKTINGNLTVNHANIVQSEIFVYNLGTMFYIDQVLYAEQLLDAVNSLPASTTPRVRTVTPTHYKYSTLPDVEAVPGEFTETNGGVGGIGIGGGDDEDDDDLLHDDEIVTPRALPVKYNLYSPK